MTSSKTLREISRELNDEIFLYERSIRQKLRSNRLSFQGSIQQRTNKFDPQKIANKLTKEQKEQKQKKRRFPTERPPGNIENGKIEGKYFKIWQNSQEKFFDVSFKASTDRSFEYSVEYEGKKIILNRNHTVIEYKGEKIMGVPSFFPNLTEMPTQSLFDNLTKIMSFVENKKKPPPAPQWKPSFHGKVGDKSLVRSKKGAGDYNGSQIHHNLQWAKQSFANIQQRYNNDEINLGEAKAKMREMLVPNSKNRTGYSIKIVEKNQRTLVILAGGTHDINSPLYFANHPMGIHPDTGKKEKFGIPKKGEGGREWFDKFRADFWREYYRRESYIAVTEINRRINKEIITKEQAIEMWRTAHEKLDKTHRNLLRLKKEADNIKNLPIEPINNYIDTSQKENKQVNQAINVILDDMGTLKNGKLFFATKSYLLEREGQTTSIKRHDSTEIFFNGKFTQKVSSKDLENLQEITKLAQDYVKEMYSQKISRGLKL